MDEGYRHYHDKVVAAVKAIDPQMLVAEGVFVPRAVGKDPKDHAGVWPGKTRDERYPPTLTTLGTGALDFLDVHPNYRFTFDGQSIVIEDFLQLLPEEQERLLDIFNTLCELFEESFARYKLCNDEFQVGSPLQCGRLFRRTELPAVPEQSAKHTDRVPRSHAVSPR